MMSVKRITIRETNILDGWSDVDGIDQEATCTAWAIALQNRLTEAYPDAEVSVECSHRTSGPGSTSIHVEDYEDRQDVEDEISAQCDHLMNDSDLWVVKAKD